MILPHASYVVDGDEISGLPDQDDDEATFVLVVPASWAEALAGALNVADSVVSKWNGSALELRVSGLHVTADQVAQVRLLASIVVKRAIEGAR